MTKTMDTKDLGSQT
uniref:Uncharacterized protein n=1 Tax=Rhizophora mucronata TaxID=61149 RepID=A0A2P2P2Q4_RHIMU